MSEQPRCELCGEPMPPGEEMFKYHGYSGPCPKPPTDRATAPEDQHEVSKELLLPYGDVAPTLQTDALHELAETQNKAAPLSDDLIARKLAEQVIRETEGDHISFDEAIDKAEALIAAALRERAAPKSKAARELHAAADYTAKLNAAAAPALAQYGESGRVDQVPSGLTFCETCRCFVPDPAFHETHGHTMRKED